MESLNQEKRLSGLSEDQESVNIKKLQKQMKMYSDYIMKKDIQLYSSEILPVLLKAMAHNPQSKKQYKDTRLGKGYVFDYKSLNYDDLSSLVQTAESIYHSIKQRKKIQAAQIKAE